MKTSLLSAFFFAAILASQPASAQRFTSKPLNQEAQDTVVAENQGGEQAYEDLKAGNLDDARKHLDSANLSDPLAIYVRASLTEEATEASDMYKEIVAENSGRPIAKEALIQLYKYHYASGNYKAAHADYVQLRKYPGQPDLEDPIGLVDSVQTFTPVGRTSTTAAQPQAVTSTSEVGSFVVQVGVFSTPENAHKFADGLGSGGMKTVVFTKTSGDKTLYAVSAGVFSTREAADSFAASLKSRSINCIVVQR